MMYTMPKNLLSICVNFALATQLFPVLQSFCTVFIVLLLHQLSILFILNISPV